MKKKESHIGFRNEKLFCFHCGNSFAMPVPIAVTMVLAIVKAFEKDHISCKKTWVEPVNEHPEEKTEDSNAMWWILNGEHGSSSKTIFNTLCWTDLKIENKYITHPHDPDDFRRCYLLLKAVPQFKDKLDKMRTVSPVWSNIVDNWDKLIEMLEEQMRTGKANGMPEFMDSIGCN